MRLLTNLLKQGEIFPSSSADAPPTQGGYGGSRRPRGAGEREPRPPGRRLGKGEAEGRSPLNKYRISHSDLIESFINYLKLTTNFRFRLMGLNKDGEIVVTIPYIHRWTDIYYKSILAKFYALEEWMKNNPGVVTMFTLTTYQGSKSIMMDHTVGKYWAVT